MIFLESTSEPIAITINSRARDRFFLSNLPGGFINNGKFGMLSCYSSAFK